MTIALIILYLFAPAAVLWLCKRVAILNKIGPVLLLYMLGIIAGNSGIIEDDTYRLQDLLVTVIIPLAIPLMLFSCDFLRWNIKGALLTLLSGTIAVVIAIISGYLIFNPILGNDPLTSGHFDKVAGMLAGVYTGGTPNLAAIKIMLDVPNETYIMVHSYDMAVSLVYLAFVLSFGIPLFRKILKHNPVNQEIMREEHINSFSAGNLGSLAAAIGLSLAIFAVAGLLSLLLPSQMQMVVVILSITSMGIAASFFKKVREIKGTYDAGMYLVYIFSIVVASMANLSRLNLKGGLYLLLFISFVIFGSLAIQLLLARVFKIDADTVLISSVSLINSPPFVPLVATAMKNRGVIITGLTVGLVGYALGNYLGYLITLIL